MQIKLTVCFDGSFWVGLFERRDGSSLSVARHVFGAEPSDPQIHQWLLAAYPSQLTFRETGIEADELPRLPRLPRNPKRACREARRQLAAGVTSKAFEAMRLALEAQKAERKSQSKAEREAEEDRRFQQRQEKRKAKHRGH
jgi:hypothetical protein